MKHIRYAVKTKKGYIRRKVSSYFEETTFDKADLYLSETQAKLSAQREEGVVVRVVIEEVTPCN